MIALFSRSHLLFLAFVLFQFLHNFISPFLYKEIIFQFLPNFALLCNFSSFLLIDLGFFLFFLFFFPSLKTLEIIDGCSFSLLAIILQQLFVKEKWQVSHFPVCIELWAKDWTWCREELSNQPSFTVRFMFKRIQKNESFQKLIIHYFAPWEVVSGSGRWALASAI